MGSYGMNISGGRDMKEKILKCLREAEDYVSGQELCQMFDVSRTAIWKVMNQLKEEGYVIDAVKNKGYRLVQTPDLVTAEEVESLLETSWAARPVVYEEEQASTNQTAKMLAEQGASHGTLVVAERQKRPSLAFAKGQRHLDEYSFETADSSDVSVYADTGSSDGCL